MAALVQGFTGLRLLTLNWEHTPARSAALITAEMSEAFPPAGNPALEAVFTVAVASMVVVAVDIDKREHRSMEFAGKFWKERDYHAAEYIAHKSI
jgi:hypothetical protein